MKTKRMALKVPRRLMRRWTTTLAVNIRFPPPSDLDADWCPLKGSTVDVEFERGRSYGTAHQELNGRRMHFVVARKELN